MNLETLKRLKDKHPHYWERVLMGDGEYSMVEQELNLGRLIAVVEAAEITYATIQSNGPFTIEQLRTWDGPVMLGRALAALNGG